MSDRTSPDTDRVRTVDVVATLSLATDMAIGVPLEHGLRSALIARRLCQHLGTDPGTTLEAFYASLLFYIGCTASASTASRLFGADDALMRYATPVRFDRPRPMLSGMARAVAPPGRPPVIRAIALARGLPRLARALPGVVAADCDVAQMLVPRLGLPPGVATVLNHAHHRWDGKGPPGSPRGDAIPLSMRVAHVARDAEFQRMLSGGDVAAAVVASRAGGAFDPDVARLLAERAGTILPGDPDASVWAEVLDHVPPPELVLDGDGIDEALAALGAFADLVSPHLLGHSGGVAALAEAAGRSCGLGPADLRSLRRAALVHDVGRVAVPARIWEARGRLSPDDWERVRLHPYHTERILSRSPFLRSLAVTAGAHHERLDGSGYHRGCAAPALSRSARLLAAADCYRSMTEPRAHRDALPPAPAAERLVAAARAGRLDADAVAAVVEAEGHRVPPIRRPAGLTPREQDVVRLLARGLQTKQVARALGVSAKTADTHIQHAYRKMGVATRAGAALFAVHHGLVPSGELPMGPGADPS